MIKKLFNRDNFVATGIDKKSKIHLLIITATLVATFVVTAFCAFDFIYVLCDVVGSVVSGSADVGIRDLIRSLPILFTLIGSSNIFVMFHYIYRNVSNEKRSRGVMYNSIASICLGVITIAYIVIGTITGVYSKLVTGYPSVLYPLDSLLGGLLIIAVGVLFLLWNVKYQEKLPYVGPNMPKGVKGVEKPFHHVLLGLWIACALYGLSAVVHSTYIVDWTHGHVFYSVMLVIMFALPVLYLMTWEFYYNQLKEENRKNLLFVAICGLCLSIVVVGLYALAYNLDPQAPDLACFGILPVDYTASINAATYIYSVCNLAVPAMVLIKALIIYKKK